MRRDFRSQLLIQIEMLRGDISHEELSRRLGAVTERYLARYVAGMPVRRRRKRAQLPQPASRRLRGSGNNDSAAPLERESGTQETGGSNEEPPDGTDGL
jgi:hypothetical protein